MVIFTADEAALPATGSSLLLVVLVDVLLAAIGTAAVTRRRPLRSDDTG